METNYTVHVFEVQAVAPSEPTPVIRDAVGSVAADLPDQVEDLAHAAAIEAWPQVHSGDVPESFGVQVIDQSAPLSQPSPMMSSGPKSPACPSIVSGWKLVAVFRDPLRQCASAVEERERGRGRREHGDELLTCVRLRRVRQ